MNVALIENAQNDIDDHHGHDQQNAEAGKRLLEGLSSALEAGVNGNGQHGVRKVLHVTHGLAERDSGRQIERERNRRKLAGVVDGEGPDARGKF